MSGLAFQARGASTGPAPVTSWFGAALPDRGFTIAIPGFWTNTNVGAGNGPYFTNQTVNTSLIANWNPYNTQYSGGANAATMVLGAAVLAPDGTMTANHITETTTTSLHIMESIYSSAGIFLYRRFAVIAQAAERTRMTMSVGLAPGVGGGSEAGCRTVFDLANVQIGVANTRYGTDTNWIPGNAQITQLTAGPNPWCLCVMDLRSSFNIFVPGNYGCVTVGPEPGSGTGSATFSYLGVSGSGINVWKTSFLPQRAWGINNVIFFDDFTSMSTIDINNTLQPGFNWYVGWLNWPLQNISPGHGNPIPSSGFLSVANSILTIDASTNNAAGRWDINPMTAAYLSGSWPPPTGQPMTPVSYVGNAFQVANGGLFECRFASTPNSGIANTRGVAFFEISAETLIAQNYVAYNSAPGGGIIGPTWSEIDFNEIFSIAGSYQGTFTLFGDNQGKVNSTGSQAEENTAATPRYQLWLSAGTYGVSGFNVPVGWNGQLYTPNTTVTPGQNPPDSNANWNVFTPAANQPIVANTLMVDYTQQHTWSTLRLPDRSKYDPYDVSQNFEFFDGNFVYYITTQGAGNLYYAVSQGKPNPLTGANVLNTQYFRGESDHMVLAVGASFPNMQFVDFVRVTQ